MRKSAHAPPTNQPSAKAKRGFTVGDLIHNESKHIDFQAGILIYPPEGKEWHLEDDELRVSGYVDKLLQWPPSPELPEQAENWSEGYIQFIADYRTRLMELDGEKGYYLCEDKSIKSSSMAYPPLWVNEGPGAPKYDHTLQVGAYALMVRRNPDLLPVPISDKVNVTYTGKDSGGTLSFWVDREDAADQAFAELTRLNTLAAQGALTDPLIAPCTCDRWPGSEPPGETGTPPVAWCAYRTIAEQTKGPRGGKRVRFVCCDGDTVWERAWKPGDDALVAA